MSRSLGAWSAWVLAGLLAWGAVASAQEDTAGTGPTFKEGDVITFDELEQIKPYLPPEFWANRDFFFYEGMQMEIGPFYRDYSGPEIYKAVSKKHGRSDG